MRVTFAEMAIAFEAALRELSKTYPIPEGFDVKLDPFGERAVLERLFNAARWGRINDVRDLEPKTRIPKDEIEAVIALIYG